ncbi:MAG: hypothetical protein HQ503_18195 [Rhodospirillales bacterium]|nr:hypothetical protein [Rhodospirillales bacterium]
MNIGYRHVFKGFLLWLALAAGTPLWAADGIITAVAYKNIPAGRAMAVRPWDNSDENMKLAKEFGTILKSRGFEVTKDAALIISFSTRDILGNWKATSRRHVLEVEGHGGRTGGEDASVRLNLFSSENGGVFNRGKEPPGTIPSRYVLEVTLDQRGGERLWKGEASALLGRTDSYALLRSMLPVLLDHMGQTVRQKPAKFK